MVVRVLLISVIVFFMFNCVTPVCMDDELSLTRKPYTGNELRIDGYFVHNYGNPERSFIYILYANGKILDGEAPLSSEIDIQEEKYKNGEYDIIAKNTKYYWGTYEISGTKIKFERWVPSNGCGLYAYTYEGKILSETSFLINQSWRESDKENTISEQNLLFNFVPFDYKPDSTNEFIK